MTRSWRQAGHITSVRILELGSTELRLRAPRWRSI